jgi:hypothetical protein
MIRPRRSLSTRIVTALVLAFLAWRGGVGLGLLPGLVRPSGVAEGLFWSPERREKQGLKLSFEGDEETGNLSIALLELLREHTPEQAVVVLCTASESASRLRFALASTGFPRVFLRVEAPDRLAALAVQVRKSTDAPIYVVLAPAFEGATGVAGPRLASAAGHTLLQFPGGSR